MTFIRLSGIKTTADVVSGILNWICPECEGWAGAEKSSSARASASKTGALFGSESLQFATDHRWTEMQKEMRIPAKKLEVI
jgi:hypothetical protein